MASSTEIVDRNLIEALTHGRLPAGASASHSSSSSLAELGLTPAEFVDLFESQVMSRHLDFAARALREKGTGFYTIGSSGHEGTVAIAKAFRTTDMAFLHYRSAGFFIQRLKSLAGSTLLHDMLLSLTASADDPISGGRHKVLGSVPGLVPPQTSTIASHLPKAVGAAFGIGRARALELDIAVPHDSIAVCSFGDASANHSTAQGAFNTAEWLAYQGVPLPIAFVCEDNGIGISVRTPPRWIESAFSHRPVLKYFSCDGLDLLDTYRCAREAETYVRRHRRPAFVHVRTVRLFGHAGADVETSYRTREEIAASEAQDPLLHSARLLIETGALDAPAILALYESVRARVARIALEAASRPRLKSAEEVMASIVPPRTPSRIPSRALSRAPLPAKPDALDGRHHLAKLLNRALAEMLERYPETVAFGEDVGKKGGVYNVTTGLQDRFGNKRVFDSLLDEQSILGTAIGMAQLGFTPIPEIQFLAYVHNAEDQIRGEAATLSFFSQGQYVNPMVIRVAGLPYQKGFGGHFHNDNSLAIFRDIPGLIVACPSNGADAVRMLRACVRAAREEGRVCVFVEPIALYMTRDLHEPGDQLWSFEYPRPEESIAPGQPGVTPGGDRLCIVSYGNGHYLSSQAARVLERAHGIRPKVIDLRWIAPIDREALLAATRDAERVLIVDECRESGSVSEALMTLFAEAGRDSGTVARVTARDSFIPLGEAATATLPSRDGIVRAAIQLVGKPATEGALDRAPGAPAWSAR